MLLDKKKNEKNVKSMLLFKLVTILKEVNMTIQWGSKVPGRVG